MITKDCPMLPHVALYNYNVIPNCKPRKLHANSCASTSRCNCLLNFIKILIGVENTRTRIYQSSSKCYFYKGLMHQSHSEIENKFLRINAVVDFYLFAKFANESRAWLRLVCFVMRALYRNPCVAWTRKLRFEEI